MTTFRTADPITPPPKSATSRRKPPPLDLGHLKDLSPEPFQDKNDITQNISEMKEKSRSKEVASSSRLTGDFPKMNSSIMLAMAAHSRLFKPGTTFSPPVTPIRPSRNRTQSASGIMESEQGEKWDQARREADLYESVPVQYRSAFQLPISATRPGLHKTPLAELPIFKVEEVGTSSTDNVPPSLAATTGPLPVTTPSPVPTRTQLLGNLSPALFDSLTARRNSFGVEEDKQSENEPSSASMLQTTSEKQSQQQLRSAFSDDDSDSSSVNKANSKSSNLIKSRNEDSDNSNSNGGNDSSNQERRRNSRLVE